MSKPHSHSYPQKDGTVGLAVVLTNCYEGDKFLAGTIHDHEKWVETLKLLNFDVRWERNLSKDLTVNFLKSVSEINVTANPDRYMCQLLVFVFCGHGVEGYLGAQDLELAKDKGKDKGKMSLSEDVLRYFFGDESNFKNVPKLLFLNTCREGQEDGNRVLESSLAKVWREGSGHYYAVSPCPSGFKTRCAPGGSRFTTFLTAEILKDQSLAEAVDNVSAALIKAAVEEKKPEPNPLSKAKVGSCSSINLKKLSPSKSGGSQAPKKATSSEGSDKIHRNSSAIVHDLGMDDHLFAGVIKSTGKLIPYIGKLVAHLTALGSALGIEDQTAAIENGPGDANGKCLKILQHWLDVNPNPTWKMLCDKLKVYDTFKAVVTMIAKDLRREQ